jgi:hypothetical protein
MDDEPSFLSQLRSFTVFSSFALCSFLVAKMALHRCRIKYHDEYAFQCVGPLRWRDNLRYKSKEKGNPVCLITGGNKPNIAMV